MADKKEYASGCYFNDPHERAPEFVVGRISVNVQKFIGWLEQQETSDKGYVNLNVKRGRDGKPYVELDTWKPAGRDSGRPQSQAARDYREASGGAPARSYEPEFDDQIPFAPCERGWLV